MCPARSWRRPSARRGRARLSSSRMRQRSRRRGRSCLPHAPRFVVIRIRPEKIREVIGPGRQGGPASRTRPASRSSRMMAAESPSAPTRAWSSRPPTSSRGICKEAEVGRLHLGKVKKVVYFGRVRGDHAGHRGARSTFADLRGADAARRGCGARGRHGSLSRSSRSTRRRLVAARGRRIRRPPPPARRSS